LLSLGSQENHNSDGVDGYARINPNGHNCKNPALGIIHLQRGKNVRAIELILG